MNGDADEKWLLSQIRSTRKASLLSYYSEFPIGCYDKPATYLLASDFSESEDKHFYDGDVKQLIDVYDTTLDRSQANFLCLQGSPPKGSSFFASLRVLRGTDSILPTSESNSSQPESSFSLLRSLVANSAGTEQVAILTRFETDAKIHPWRPSRWRKGQRMEEVGPCLGSSGWLARMSDYRAHATSCNSRSDARQGRGRSAAGAYLHT